MVVFVVRSMIGSAPLGHGVQTAVAVAPLPVTVMTPRQGPRQQSSAAGVYQPGRQGRQTSVPFLRVHERQVTNPLTLFWLTDCHATQFGVIVIHVLHACALNASWSACNAAAASLQCSRLCLHAHLSTLPSAPKPQPGSQRRCAATAAAAASSRLAASSRRAL